MIRLLAQTQESQFFEVTTPSPSEPRLKPTRKAVFSLEVKGDPATRGMNPVEEGESIRYIQASRKPILFNASVHFSDSTICFSSTESIHRHRKIQD